MSATKLSQLAHAAGISSADLLYLVQNGLSKALDLSVLQRDLQDPLLFPISIKDKGGQVYNVRSYGAKVDGVTDDTASIQAALNACGAAGGGIVFVPAGVAYCALFLDVLSNTHLMGAGIGATIIRNPATCGGVSIQVKARHHVTISDLTVDHATNNTAANGIQLVPSNDALTVCTYCTIERCEVLGYDTHQYLIWSRRAQHVRIVGNIVNGGVSVQNAASEEEGIEVYGGLDVLVAHNTILNVGSAGLNIYTDTNANSSTTAITFAHNSVDTAQYGINCALLSPSSGVSFINNSLRNIFVNGIGVSSGSVTTVGDMLISQNRIYTVSAYCLIFSVPVASTLSNILVCNNIFDAQSPAGTVYGIAIAGAKNITLKGNIITNVIGHGIFLFASGGQTPDNIWLDGNRFDALTRHGVYCLAAANLRITNNQFLGYNSTHGAWQGVHLESAVGALIANNQFKGDSTETNPVNADATCSSVEIGDNYLLYTPTLTPVYVNGGATPQPYRVFSDLSMVESNAYGMILKDRSDGHTYRLKVTAGVLGVEQIT